MRQNRSSSPNPDESHCCIERQRNRADSLLRLHRDLAIRLASTSSLQEALDAILKASLQIDGIDCGGVYLVDGKTGALNLVAHQGISSEFAEAVGHHAPGTLQCRMALSGQVLYSRCVDIVPHNDECCYREGLCAIAFVPIQYHGRKVGVLILASRWCDEIPPSSRCAIDAIAMMIGGVVARVTLETELRSSRENLRAIFDAISDPAWLKDAQGRYQAVNLPWCRFAGKEPQDVVGKTDCELLPADIAGLFLTTDRKAAEQNRPVRLDQCIQTLQGGVTWYETTVSPLVNGQGEFIGTTGIAHDITDRKRLENDLHEARQKLEERVLERTSKLIRANQELRREIKQRQQAEGRLRENEAKLKEAQRLAQIASWEWTIETDTMVWTEEIFRLAGLDPASVPANHQGHAKLLAPDSWKQLDLAVEQAKRDGKPYESDLEVVLPGGTRKWFKNRGEAVRDPNGRIVRLRGTVQDISESKRAEEDVRRSEACFRGVFENAGVGIAIADANGRLVLTNPAFLTLLGYAGEEMPPTSVKDISYPEDYELEQSYLQEILAGNRSTYELEKRFVRKDGTIIWVHLDTSVIRDAAGHAILIIGVVQDISERVRTARALQESEERLRLAMQASNMGWWQLDRITGTLTADDCAKAHCGLPASTIPSLDLALQAVHPDDRCLIQRKIAERDASGNHQAEFRVVWPDGSVHWLFAKGRTFFGGIENPSYLLGVVTDVTASKAAEEALLHAARLKTEIEKLATTSRMAARIAHEINNPIAGIRNAFHLFKDAIPKGSPEHRYVERAEREIDRVTRTIRQMYDLHRPNQEQMTDVRISDTIEEVAMLLQPLCCERGVRVEFPFRLPDVIARLPEGALRQILFSLITNAIEASPRAAVVRIGMELKDEGLWVGISDQGCGIPLELRTRIFEPFFTTKTGRGTEGGLGLGLSTARQLTDVLGGYIEFESDVGKGTVFRILIPLSGKENGKHE